MRKHGRRDANHSEIVNALRGIGLEARAERDEVIADACELANLVLMIGDVTDAGDLELVNKYTGRN